MKAFTKHQVARLDRIHDADQQARIIRDCTLPVIVAAARRAGLPWDEIGAALSITGRAAHYRYARITPALVAELNCSAFWRRVNEHTDEDTDEDIEDTHEDEHRAGPHEVSSCRS